MAPIPQPGPETNSAAKVNQEEKKPINDRSSTYKTDSKSTNGVEDQSDYMNWLNRDKEGFFEDFLFRGNSRLQKLIPIPDVGREHYLKIRNKDQYKTISENF